MVSSTSTLPQTSRIPARFALPVTTATGLRHLVGDDVYTVTMVMLGHRPYTALCGAQVNHAAPTTRVGDTCPVCATVADHNGLRRVTRPTP
jgi:hypothetical protein